MVPSLRRGLPLLAVLFIFVTWFHYRSRYTPTFTYPDPGDVYSGHPISKLVAKNRAHFEALLIKQSRTLQEARDEYLRRYARQPPPGFDAWFSLAQNYGFVLIDEFDTFMEGLKPFFDTPPDILKQKVASTIEVLGDRINVLEIRDGEIKFPESLEGFVENLMLNREWLKLIPYDLTLLINTFDEPMVCFNLDRVAAGSDPDVLTSPIRVIEVHKQNGWTFTSSACREGSLSLQPSCPSEKKLEFVDDMRSAQDVCQNCALPSTHGLLLSPGNLPFTPDVVPIWSASRPSHFNDILYPSPYYMAKTQAALDMKYESDMDPAWNRKKAQFYWTGSSTGGWATADTWRHMHRQRLVLDTNNRTMPIELLETDPETHQWKSRLSTLKEVSLLFSTRFTAIVQCADDACQLQKEAFGVSGRTKHDHLEDAYDYKFVIDVDGNGFSGRYYRLLQSGSVVVKQTILKEWHDDRLMPWVHYVPLSTLYTELPELARFLATTEEGLAISERIARESTEWHSKALRDVDIQLVWLRMMLEFGRIMKNEVDP